MIYLASPYTHTDYAVMKYRFEAVCEKAAELMREGKMVFSPIAHSHVIAGYGLPVDWSYWKNLGEAWIKLCDEFSVFMLDGWRDSVGVTAEIEIATQEGRSISYLPHFDLMESDS